MSLQTDAKAANCSPPYTIRTRPPPRPFQAAPLQFPGPSQPGHTRTVPWSAVVRVVQGEAKQTQTQVAPHHPARRNRRSTVIQRGHATSLTGKARPYGYTKRVFVYQGGQPCHLTLTPLWNLSKQLLRHPYQAPMQSPGDLDLIQPTLMSIETRRPSLGGALASQFASTLSLQPLALTHAHAHTHSPSSESTFSDHSLFSDHSRASSTTTVSRPTSSSDDFLSRRRSVLHAATFEYIPRPCPFSVVVNSVDGHADCAAPAPATATVPSQTAPYHPFNNNNSRYYTRRNAVTLDDVKEPAYGPIRTLRGMKTARPLFCDEKVCSLFFSFRVRHRHRYKALD